MSETSQNRKQTEPNVAADAPLERTLKARLRAVRNSNERRTIMSLARELGRLPVERSRAIWETSAGLASISLRASVEFLRAASAAAQTLYGEELRAWGDFVRRLTMADVETGVNFITSGIDAIEAMPRAAKLLLFEVCTRQLALSSSIALETFQRAPQIAAAAIAVGRHDAERIGDAAAYPARAPDERFAHDEYAKLLCGIYRVAAIIAQRSAKHSADFLRATPAALNALRAVAAVTNSELQPDIGSVTFGSEDATRQSIDDRNPLEREAEQSTESNPPANADDPPSDDSEAPTSYPKLFFEALTLAEEFALRAGGVAADVWMALPIAVRDLTSRESLKLFACARECLERGGAAALQVFAAGGEAMRRVPEAFDAWLELLRAVGECGGVHGNAATVALARTSPSFFRAFVVSKSASHAERKEMIETIARVIAAAQAVARVDVEAAIACFRSGAAALGGNWGANSKAQTLRASSIDAFERWAREGLNLMRNDARARRSYYALETRHSQANLRGVRANGAIDEARAELLLEQVAPTLRLYVEALTGRAVEVAPLARVPQEAKIEDGRVIHLPASVAEFETEDLNFKLYKTLAAHAAGQIEFGTRAVNDHSPAGGALRAAYEAIAETYSSENVDARDAFALSGYIAPVEQGERALAPEEAARRREKERKRMPSGADFRAVLQLFPLSGLAARIFTTLENGRIDRRLRHAYRGLARDLDFVREHLRRRRPRIAELPLPLVPFELLFQIALCGGAREDARTLYGQVVSELEGIVADYLSGADASVGDTLMATSRVYSLFQSVVPDEAADDEEQSETGETSEGEATASEADESEQATSETERKQRARREKELQDARDLFNAWSQTADFETEPDDLYDGELWTPHETPEQELDAGDKAFFYDEWDRDLADARVGWCRVIEKRVRRGDRSFVEVARSRYKGVISSIRHQFQLLKPESLLRVKNELDGDDYNLDAVIEYIADRRSDGRQSERLYTKRLRRERDVAVAFLLDQSSSTARTIARNPLQPYTHPGRRIIDIEKEGLVLMSEALEAVGDRYAIYGFTSEGRHNVKFYVIKDFAEKYTEETERRIGGITYHHNTRLGAAIRHAAARLSAEEARTRLLIVLSDGRPYDHDYGDARYAREDTRAALSDARRDGVKSFCITIDKDSEIELRDLYGETGYTIIDDVLSLPERLPAIYGRLTT